ncbi:uncharacterized protein LOC5504159 isoform X1 [Nematostella vectensis]|uniref:uncharacterized protein LOC5504159 isoform X1 n=1 Tax=Nematostella vectensis TaxID=45351 RepID=UPI002076FB1B|nr:uncharacterized protein LOC5504159 isoform X1 [Nematostella vectensis]
MASKKFVVVEWVNNAEDRREFTVLRGSDIIPKTGEVLRQGCVVSVVYREKAADTPRLYDAEVLQIFDSQRKAKQFENELLERGNDSDQETPRPKKRKPCQKVVEAASLNDETSGGKHANKRPKSNKSKSGDVRTPKPKELQNTVQGEKIRNIMSRRRFPEDDLEVSSVSASASSSTSRPINALQPLKPPSNTPQQLTTPPHQSNPHDHSHPLRVNLITHDHTHLLLVNLIPHDQSHPLRVNLILHNHQHILRVNLMPYNKPHRYTLHNHSGPLHVVHQTPHNHSHPLHAHLMTCVHFHPLHANPQPDQSLLRSHTLPRHSLLHLILCKPLIL